MTNRRCDQIVAAFVAKRRRGTELLQKVLAPGYYFHGMAVQLLIDERWGAWDYVKRVVKRLEQRSVDDLLKNRRSLELLHKCLPIDTKFFPSTLDYVDGKTGGLPVVVPTAAGKPPDLSRPSGGDLWRVGSRPSFSVPSSSYSLLDPGYGRGYGVSVSLETWSAV